MKTIRKKVYRILREKDSIGGKKLQEEYRKRYNEALNYYTALNYKVDYKAGNETKHNPQETLKKFINRMCLTGAGYSIRKERLLKAFNTYLSGNGLERIGLRFLTRLMHDLDYEDTTCRPGAIRYLGISLTSQAAKELLDDQDYHRFERAERISKMRGRENISSEEACKFICCKPAQKFLKKIAEKYLDKYSYRKIRKILIKVEEVCGVGKYIRPQIAVAVSIYIFSKLYLDGGLSQDYVCEIVDTTPYKLRRHLGHVMERVEFRKDPDAEYNFSLETVEEGVHS